MRSVVWWLGMVSVAVLCACAPTRPDTKLLDETLDRWASTVRWGEPAMLVEFIDPALREREPVRALELERLRQFRIAAYRPSPPVMLAPDRARQSAEVELINVHSQTSRISVDVTEWRYDAAARRWWLISGLPRFPPRD